MKKRILSLLLVFVMLLSLLPAGVLAAEGDVSVTLSGMHDAQVKSLKLYTYMDGVKGRGTICWLKRQPQTARIPSTLRPALTGLTAMTRTMTATAAW